jgi:hypothetical protein
MAIVYEKLLNLAIPTIEQTYAPKDAMLYALGVGLGLDPMDRGQLDFVFEKNLKVLPTFAVVLAHPGLWVRDLDTGIDAVKARPYIPAKHFGPKSGSTEPASAQPRSSAMSSLFPTDGPNSAEPSSMRGLD